MQRNYDFGFTVRPALRLAQIELILKATRVVSPVPSRVTLIKLIDDGTLEGRMVGRVWVVYEDSFHKWVRSFQPDSWEPVKPQPNGARP
jgi:hypothetical protein